MQNRKVREADGSEILQKFLFTRAVDFALYLLTTYLEFGSHKIEFPSICKHFEKLFIEWIHLFAEFFLSDNFAQYEIDP